MTWIIWRGSAGCGRGAGGVARGVRGCGGCGEASGVHSACSTEVSTRRRQRARAEVERRRHPRHDRRKPEPTRQSPGNVPEAENRVPQHHIPAQRVRCCSQSVGLTGHPRHGQRAPDPSACVPTVYRGVRCGWEGCGECGQVSDGVLLISWHCYWHS
jgi:hypothetical protein